MEDIKFLRRSSAGNTGLGVDLESNEIFDMTQKMNEEENSDEEDKEKEEQTNPKQEPELLKNKQNLPIKIVTFDFN